MWTYILRRLILMVPTIFGITVVTFLIVQLSPGDPLQAMLAASGAANTTSITREAYLIQKRQFNLDKPILLNFRYWYDYTRGMNQCAELRGKTAEDLTELVEELYKQRDTTDPALRERLDFIRGLGIDGFEKRFNDESLRPTLGRLVEVGVQLRVENTGLQGVAPLIDILRKSKDVKKRIGAIRSVSIMVDEPFVYTYSKEPDDDETERIAATWQIWWDRNKASSRPVPADRLSWLGDKFAKLVAIDSRGQLLEGVKDLKRDDVPFFAEKLLGTSSLKEKYVASLAMRVVVGKPLKVDVKLNEREALVNEVADNWIRQFEARRAYYEPGFFKKVGLIFWDTQYARLAFNLVSFQFGRSMVGNRDPVGAKIWNAVTVSAPLMLLTEIIIYFIAIPLGILCAVHRGKLADRLISLGLFLLYSIPGFVAAMLLLVFLCYGDFLKIFPFDGTHGEGAEKLSFIPWFLDYLWHIALPVLCLSIFSMAGLAMYSRTSMLDVINQDYIRTARAKGVAERWVIYKHGMRNAMIPVITLFASFIPAMLGGSVIIEVLFNIPGMGRLSFDAIYMKDITTLMALTYIDAIIVLLSVLLSDLLYVVVDPRISFGKADG